MIARGLGPVARAIVTARAHDDFDTMCTLIDEIDMTDPVQRVNLVNELAVVAIMAYTFRAQDTAPHEPTVTEARRLFASDCLVHEAMEAAS